MGKNDYRPRVNSKGYQANKRRPDRTTPVHRQRYGTTTPLPENEKPTTEAVTDVIAFVWCFIIKFFSKLRNKETSDVDARFDATHDAFCAFLKEVGINVDRFKEHLQRYERDILFTAMPRDWLVDYLETSYREADLKDRRLWTTDPSQCLVNVFHVNKHFTETLIDKVQKDFLMDHSPLFWTVQHVVDQLDLPSQRFVDFIGQLPVGECRAFTPMLDQRFSNGDPYSFVQDTDESSHEGLYETEEPAWWPITIYKGSYESKLLQTLKEANDTDGDPLEQFYFHSTTWANAESIIMGGCMPSVGSKTQDFGSAYYLNHTWAKAVKWTRKRFAANDEHRTAILVYAFADTVFDELKVKKYGIFTDVQVANRDSTFIEWQKNVYMSRVPKGNQKTTFMFKDVVVGPMLLNPPGVARAKWDQLKPSSHLQTALLSLDAAMTVDPYLIGVIINDPFPGEPAKCMPASR